MGSKGTQLLLKHLIGQLLLTAQTQRNPVVVVGPGAGTSYPQATRRISSYSFYNL
jgi:hypothetical protein